ncbi:MAG: ABC transporter substrate-binding protein, partial [candidate division NC10 bacterium]
TRDDEARPDRAVAAAEELITRLRVAALVGGYVDTLVGPISEVAERQKVPYVATASLDERLTQRGYRYFFRISHLQAYVDSMVGIVVDVFKPRSVAILKGFLGAFGMEFPEVVRDLGPSGQFLFGTTGWEPGITEPGTEAASRAFVEGYRKRFGVEPPPLAMHGYVGARAILVAAERAASRSREVGPEAVRQGLQALDLLTPLERLQFDSRGEAKNYRRLIVQIQGNARVVVYPTQRATGKPVYPMPPWKER